MQTLREAPLANAAQGSEKLGDKTSFASFAAAELCKLHDALLDFGAKDFKLVGVVLCIRSASSAEHVPQVVAVPSGQRGESQPGKTGSEMYEIHLPGIIQKDPFKAFFADPGKNEVFTRTVLGRGEVCCERDDLDQYVPSGYWVPVNELNLKLLYWGNHINCFTYPLL